MRKLRRAVSCGLARGHALSATAKPAFGTWVPCSHLLRRAGCSRRRETWVLTNQVENVLPEEDGHDNGVASNTPNGRPGFEPYFLHWEEPERTEQFCAETLDTSRAAWGLGHQGQPRAGKEATPHSEGDASRVLEPGLSWMEPSSRSVSSSAVTATFGLF